MTRNGVQLLLIICSFFVSSISFSQTQTFSPKGSISIDMGVPAKPKNQAFERTMEGLFNGGIDYRYNLYKGLTLGVGLKYSFFTINSFAFNNNAITGGYQMPAAFLHLGYEKFTTERVSLGASIRGGYSYLMSFNDSCKTKHGGQHISSAFFLEPQVEMVMLTDKVSEHGFSMVIGYNIYFNEFSNEELCVDVVPTVTPESYEGLTRFLSIGFGYRYYLGRN